MIYVSSIVRKRHHLLAYALASVGGGYTGASSVGARVQMYWGFPKAVRAAAS